MSARASAIALALALGTSALALAQPDPGQVSRGDLMKRRQYQTFGAATLYVDPTGNDGNGCTATGTSACLTIQGAIDKIPKGLVKNPVTINVAAGTYAAATISGYTFDYPSDSTVGSYIYILGTLANSTGLATGSATGTASAGSAGSAATFGTLTDAAATWTTNDLRGRFITTLTGTGAGQTRVIASNTGTVITIAGVWTAPANLTTYAIQDSASIINTTKDIPVGPNSIAAGNGGALSAYSNNSTIPIGAGNSGADIYIKQMRMTISSSGRGYVGAGAFRTVFDSSQFVMTALAAINAYQNHMVTVINSSITETSTSSAMLTVAADQPGGYLSFQNSSISSTGTPSSTLLAITNLSSLNFTGSFITAPGSLISVGPYFGNTLISNSRFDCQSNGASTGLALSPIGTAVGANPSGMIITASDFSNCNIGIASTAGVRMANLTGVVSGSGNTTGISISKGAKFQISATSTISGATNEVLMDGTNYTLAAMRAASPKSICDLSYLTCFYE